MVSTDKEKEELMEKIAKLEREMGEKKAEAEILKLEVYKPSCINWSVLFSSYCR